MSAAIPSMAPEDYARRVRASRARLELVTLDVCPDCYAGAAGWSDLEAGRPMPTVPVDVSPGCGADDCTGCEYGEPWFSARPCEGYGLGYGCQGGDLAGDRLHATLRRAGDAVS